MIDKEIKLRERMWEAIGGDTVVRRVSPSRLRDLGLYGGQQGIWIDKSRTGKLTDDGYGLAVSVLHKGDVYPDDFDETGVIYHYPNTNRPKSRDIGEIEAVKNCKRYWVPIFVIRINPDNSGLRDVFRGHVTYWNDESEAFIIEFAVTDQDAASFGTDSAFRVREESDRTYQADVTSRDARFRIAVLSRYGTQCAVCDVSVVDLLDAAHLVPKSERGSDDPRNGIVFCSLHHRAFDRGYFAIDPQTLEISKRPKGPSLGKLKISRRDLSHLSKLPHQKALDLAWRLWKDEVDA
jgi:hypothetical protein